MQQGQATEFLQLMLGAIRTLPLPHPPLCPIPLPLLAPQLVDRGLQAPTKPPRPQQEGKSPWVAGVQEQRGLKVHTGPGREESLVLLQAGRVNFSLCPWRFFYSSAIPFRVSEPVEGSSDRFTDQP